MKPLPTLATFALLAAFPLTLAAQDFAPPNAKPPDEATLKAIVDKTARLGNALSVLRRQGIRDPLLADVEIYHKAAVWIVRHGEYFTADAGAGTVDILDRGLLRARLLAGGESPWLQQTGASVVRAYRSRVDGSVQPYAITFPADYGKDSNRKWRLDVVLHGRDATITEMKFLRAHSGDKPAPKDLNYILLDIYGRGNNAYRWAGETDVQEAIGNFLAVERIMGREQLQDPARRILRGFSMGGAGSWHLGLHYPDSWCAVGPGAGFTTTHGYIKTLPETLPPYQESCLRIYDAVDYAENAANVPIVAYAGDEDPQLAAAKNIEAILKPKGIPMTLLVGTGLAHKFPPEWQQKAEAVYASNLHKGKEEYPAKVRFVTYTLKYSSCNWVEIISLKKHYDKAIVDAEKTDAGFTVKTTNVEALSLRLPMGLAYSGTVKIDGQTVEARPWLSRDGNQLLYLQRDGDAWRDVLPQRLLVDRVRQPRKARGMQGPIDDAFTDSFLCVRPTGKGWHEATQKQANANLDRFRSEWNKFMRGDLPVKGDMDVTEEDIAGRNLILFGDPASNSLIAQALPALPLLWNKEQIVVNDKAYGASEHVPALIFPSPFNSTHYVVLNSGHTFRAADFKGTNALLYPRLGDYAILKVPGEEIVTAGIFDERWRIPR